MKDRYGRKIEYMRVSVTDRCNLRCIYCMPEGGVPCVSHDDILRFDEIGRVCRIAAGMGISKIKLTGGEPLVRRGLPDLAGKLKRIPGVEQVTLTTNGILLKDYINELVSNGLDAVNISIDTLDAERYKKVTRGGEISRALEGLEAALEYPQFRVKVNCVPFIPSGECMDSPTEEDWIELAQLARTRPVEVRFIEMMPIGIGQEYRGKGREEICAVLEKAFGTPEAYRGKSLGNGPAEYVVFPGFAGRIGFISAVSHQFCSTCNRIRLTSEGYLKACLQYDIGEDLRGLLRGGASDERIREVMEKVICEKPACHHFGGRDRNGENSGNISGSLNEADPADKDAHVEKREMARIGG